MISVSFPGKLFILGEYAIMEPGNTALIASVNRYIEAKITKNGSLYIESDFGSITDTMVDPKMDYVFAALNVAKDLIKHHSHDFNPFKLKLISELNSENNKKYGFGSSGVVIIATLDAILKFHNITLNKLELFKLAVVTQKRMNRYSSGGDLAASIYPGIVVYTRYDLQSVKEDVSCIYDAWDKLDIYNIDNPYTIEVGYTGKSHDTNVALEVFKSMKSTKPEIYKELLKQSQIIVKKGITEDLLEAVTQYRQWMLRLQSYLEYDIETRKLTDLIENANTLNYHAKISGSGGGDCGIALTQTIEDNTKLKKMWNLHDIELIEGAIQ